MLSTLILLIIASWQVYGMYHILLFSCTIMVITIRFT